MMIAEKTTYKPGYLNLLETGKFEERVKQAQRLLQNCRVCPWNCRVNRLAGELGKCQTGRFPLVSSAFPHFGEEAPLVGLHGSGTIFMAGCNLLCDFCQNYEISHLREGREVTSTQLGRLMLDLQDMGCHNINVVTPSHVVPQLIEALYFAAQQGLSIPLVYNTSAYDSLSSLALLNGLVDIYMPDFKFFDDAAFARYSPVKNYATIAKHAIKEMHRQVGDLQIDSRGIAVRGLLIRHLVMPGYLEQSRKIFHFIAREISPNTYVNIMAQYRPHGEAFRYPEINRVLQHREFQQAIQMAREAGLHRLDGPIFH